MLAGITTSCCTYAESADTLKDMTTAQTPEDITRLFVERVNAGDAEGLADLYEPDAVIAFPPGQITVGRDAIVALYEGMLAAEAALRVRGAAGHADQRRPRADRHAAAG